MPNSIRPSPVRDAIQVVLEIETINKSRERLSQQIRQRETRIKRLDRIAKIGVFIWTCVLIIELMMGSDPRKTYFVLMSPLFTIPCILRWTYGESLISQNKRANEEDAAYLKKLTELERPAPPEDYPIIPASASELPDYADLPNSAIISIGKHGA